MLFREFAKHLDRQGFTFTKGERCACYAVVHQHFGIAGQCDWLELGRHPDGYRVAWLTGTDPGPVVVHEGWSREGAIRFVDPANGNLENLQFVRHEGGLDLYYNQQSNEYMYMPTKYGQPSNPD